MLENVIKEIFSEHTDLKRTLNSQEYLARGATIIASRWAGNPQAQQYRVIDCKSSAEEDESSEIVTNLEEDQITEMATKEQAWQLKDDNINDLMIKQHELATLCTDMAKKTMEKYFVAEEYKDL